MADNNHSTLRSLFSDIANSIRGKTEWNNTIIADTFPEAIDKINWDATIGSSSQLMNGVIAYGNNGKYVGSIQSKTENDLIINGANVTVPSGYYGNNATANVGIGNVVSNFNVQTGNFEVNVSNGYVNSYHFNNSIGLSNPQASANVNINGAVVTGYVIGNAGYTNAFNIAVSGTVNSGTINAKVTNHSVTNPTINVIYDGNIGTTVQPSGNYYKISFNSTVTNGSSKTKASANVLTNGYVDPSKDVNSTWSNKTVTANVTLPNTYYVNKGNMSTGNISGEAYLETTNDYGFRVNVSIPEGYYDGTQTVVKNFTTGIFPAPNSKATSNKMLVGYSLYDEDGRLVTGNMPNIVDDNNTITTQGGTYSIAEGYHDGNGVITALLPNGSATTPTTTIYTDTPTISEVNSATGTISVRQAVGKQNIRPTVVSGYIENGTNGIVTAMVNNFTINVTQGSLSTSSNVDGSNIHAIVGTYDNQNNSYPLVGNSTVSFNATVSVGPNGWINSDASTVVKNNKNISVSGSLPRTNVTTSIYGVPEKKSVLQIGNFPNGVVNAVAYPPIVTNVVPTSGVYVVVNAPANNGTITASIDSVTRGFSDGNLSNTGINQGTATAGAAAIEDSYIKIREINIYQNYPDYPFVRGFGEGKVINAGNGAVNSDSVNMVSLTNVPTNNYYLVNTHAGWAQHVHPGWMNNDIYASWENNLYIKDGLVNVSVTGNTTKKPVLRYATTPNNVINASGGTITTTVPSSGVYISVNTPSNVETSTSTINVNAGYVSVSSQVNVTGKSSGASAMSDTYIPIKEGNVNVTQASVSTNKVNGWVNITQGWVESQNIEITGNVSAGNYSATQVSPVNIYPQVTGTVTNISTATKPSGTDGIDYYTINPDAQYINGNARARINNAGYLAASNKFTNITGSVQEGTNTYIKKGVATTSSQLITVSPNIFFNSQNGIAYVKEESTVRTYTPQVTAGYIEAGTSGNLDINIQQNFINIGLGTTNIQKNNIRVDGNGVLIYNFNARVTTGYQSANNYWENGNLQLTPITMSSFENQLGKPNAYVYSEGLITNVNNGAMNTSDMVVFTNTPANNYYNLAIDAYWGIQLGVFNRMGGWINSSTYLGDGWYNYYYLKKGSVNKTSVSPSSSTQTVRVSDGYYSNNVDITINAMAAGALSSSGAATAPKPSFSINSATGVVTATVAGFTGTSYANVSTNGYVDTSNNKSGTVTGTGNSNTYQVPNGYIQTIGEISLLDNGGINIVTTGDSNYYNFLLRARVNNLSIVNGYINNSYIQTSSDDYRYYIKKGTIATGNASVLNNANGNVIYYRNVTAGYIPSDNTTASYYQLNIKAGSTTYLDNTSEITLINQGQFAIGNINVKVNAGAYSATQVTAVGVTPSVGGTVTSIATTTKPSGTDGTDYWTVDPGATATNGNARARINNAGYISAGNKYVNITGSVGAGTNYYINKASVSSTSVTPYTNGTAQTVTVSEGYVPGQVNITVSGVASTTHPSPSINKSTFNTTSGNVEITANHVQGTGYVVGNTTSASKNVVIGLTSRTANNGYANLNSWGLVINASNGTYIDEHINLSTTKANNYYALCATGNGEVSTGTGYITEGTTASWDGQNFYYVPKSNVTSTTITPYTNGASQKVNFNYGYVPDNSTITVLGVAAGTLSKLPAYANSDGLVTNISSGAVNASDKIKTVAGANNKYRITGSSGGKITKAGYLANNTNVSNSASIYVNKATSSVTNQTVTGTISASGANASTTITGMETTSTNTGFIVSASANATSGAITGGSKTAYANISEGYTPSDVSASAVATVSNVSAKTASNSNTQYIKAGSATISGTIYTGTSTLTVNQNNGYVTAPSVSKATSLTPTVVEGYIKSGTAGSVTANFNVSGLQLTTKTGAGSNYKNNLYVSPYTNGTAQTIMNRNEFLIANHIIVNGVATGVLGKDAASATLASNGSVTNASNHAVNTSDQLSFTTTEANGRYKLTAYGSGGANVTTGGWLSAGTKNNNSTTNVYYVNKATVSNYSATYKKQSTPSISVAGNGLATASVAATSQVVYRNVTEGYLPSANTTNMTFTMNASSNTLQLNTITMNSFQNMTDLPNTHFGAIGLITNVSNGAINTSDVVTFTNTPANNYYNLMIDSAWGKQLDIFNASGAWFASGTYLGESWDNYYYLKKGSVSSTSVTPYTNGTAQTVTVSDGYLPSQVNITVSGVAAGTLSAGRTATATGLINVANGQLNSSDKMSISTSTSGGSANKYVVNVIGYANVSTNGYVTNGSNKNSKVNYYVNKSTVSNFSANYKAQSTPTFSYNATTRVLTASVAQTTQTIYRNVSEGYVRVANSTGITFIMNASSNTYTIPADNCTYDSNNTRLIIPTGLIIPA